MTLVWGNIKLSQVTYDGPDESLNVEMESILFSLRTYIKTLDVSTRQAYIHIVCTAITGERIDTTYTVKSDDLHFQQELENAVAEYLDNYFPQ